MRSVLSKELRCSRRKIFVGDKFLTPITEKNFGVFLLKDATDLRKYQPNIFECNLFALNLVTNAKNYFLNGYDVNAAVGMLWVAKTSYTEAHALNFFVNPSLSIHVIEPQNDLEVFLGNYGRVEFVYI
jgi:hypothetical protein